jgi:hypothetical protein
VTAESVDRALTAARSWLAGRDAPAAIIAASEHGAGDAEAARRAIRRLVDEQDDDGSWGGDLLATAEIMLTIQELRSAAELVERGPELGRALDWMRSRRGVPGAWSDGCSPDRHSRGLCHHFAGGFFSPGPPEVPFEDATLRSGARVSGDLEVRFVASALALRSLLTWEAGGTDTRLHLETLRRAVAAWGEHAPDGLSNTSLLAAVHALVYSSASADWDAAATGIRLVGGRQRGDGSWVDTDAFQALEVFGAAADVGIAEDRTRRGLWHGARLLISTQQADGSWGEHHGARRALIACRTFHRVDPDPA